MGKSAPKAPAAVDPNVAAAAQTNSNVATAQEQQRLGMVGTSGPGGSVNYVKDPNAPGGYRQETTLSSGQQGLYDLGQKAQTGALGLADDQVGRINSALSKDFSAPDLQTSIGPTDFSADRDAATNAAFGRAKSRLDPQWENNEASERDRLANQGFSQNSTGYTKAMDDFGRSKNDAYDTALSSAVLTGDNEQKQLFDEAVTKAGTENTAKQQGFANSDVLRSTPLNEFAALLGTGGAIQMPAAYGGGGAPVAPTDVMGAYGLNANQNQNAYNAKVGQVNSANQATSQAAATTLAAIIAAML